MGGRPKKDQGAEESVEIVRETLIERKFTPLKGRPFFVSVSAPFTSAPETKDEKPEMLCLVSLLGAGWALRDVFELPTKAIPTLRNAIVSGLCLERNKFLAEVNYSQEAVHIRLSRFTPRAHGGYLGIMEFALPVPVNQTSRDPVQTAPIIWFDQALAMVEAEVGDTVVVKSDVTTQTGSASLDEINSVIAASALN